jgi:hypothetical protein
MLTGGLFFVVVMILGLGVFGFCGLAGLHYKRATWDYAERDGWRLAMEFSLASVAFALIPFLFEQMFDYESVVWRLASFTLAVFLFVEIGKIYYKANLYGARSPLIMGTLLVLSGIMLTIEFANMFWEHSMPFYASGVLWLLFLSAIQFIAFVAYDGHPNSNEPKIRSVGKIEYGHHGVLAKRVRRQHRAVDPNGATNGYTYVHRDPVNYARRQRYSNTLANAVARNANRRSVANASTRRDKDAAR